MEESVAKLKLESTGGEKLPYNAAGVVIIVDTRLRKPARM
jgi:hypothetical protein